MIYIIIGRDTKGNEWVMSDTYENPTEAANRCQELNSITEGLAADDVYRVDTLEPSEGVTARQAFKLKANSIYGKRDPFYQDTDSLHTSREFTMTELFGWYDGIKASDRIINCHECGCVVSYDGEMMEKHRTWHNGVADL